MLDPGRPLTLPAALAEAAQRHADRTAYVDYPVGRERRTTWTELDAAAAEAAAGLVALGLAPGDRVAIVAENSREWMVACHAVVRAGAVAVPVYYELKPAEIANQIGRTECRIVVASAAALPRLPAESPGLERVVAIGEGSPAGMMAFEAIAAAATEASRTALAERTPRPDDLAAIFFTSGSTGGPKGVMLSHRNLLANGHAILGAIEVSAADRVLLVLPLHHSMPFQAAVVLPPLVGATVAIENDLPRLRDRMLDLRPTVFFGVPALYEIMYRNVLARAAAEGRLVQLEAWRRRLGWLKRTTGVNLAPLVFRPLHRTLGGELRFLFSGGAALDPTTAQAFFSLGLPLLQGWGMTEASPVIAVQRFSMSRFRYTRYYERHAGSVGPPLSGVEVRLVDVPEKQIEVAQSGEGEVLVRGDNVFSGYWRDEAATAEALVDGWLHTGDLGRIDRAGNIYLTGRSKYVIVLDSGEKVHPDEVEAKLAESPLLADVFVTGRRVRERTQVVARVYPDPEATRELCKRQGLGLSEESVRRLVAAEVETLGRQLAPYKRVVDVELSDLPLPKTALRKVAREEVAAEASFSLDRWLAGPDEGA